MALDVRKCRREKIRHRTYVGENQHINNRLVATAGQKLSRESSITSFSHFVPLFSPNTFLFQYWFGAGSDRRHIKVRNTQLVVWWEEKKHKKLLTSPTQTECFCLPMEVDHITREKITNSSRNLVLHVELNNRSEGREKERNLFIYLIRVRFAKMVSVSSRICYQWLQCERCFPPETCPTVT